MWSIPRIAAKPQVRVGCEDPSAPPDRCFASLPILRDHASTTGPVVPPDRWDAGVHPGLGPCESGAATAWVTDELPAAPARTPPRAVAPEGARTPPPGDKAADAEGPTEAARADLATRLDQLIVRHATWRSVGVTAGLATAAIPVVLAGRARPNPAM